MKLREDLGVISSNYKKMTKIEYVTVVVVGEMMMILIELMAIMVAAMTVAKVVAVVLEKTMAKSHCSFFYGIC
jgi:hypothetical protein